MCVSCTQLLAHVISSDRLLANLNHRRRLTSFNALTQLTMNAMKIQVVTMSTHLFNQGFLAFGFFLDWNKTQAVVSTNNATPPELFEPLGIPMSGDRNQ